MNVCFVFFTVLAKYLLVRQLRVNHRIYWFQIFSLQSSMNLRIIGQILLPMPLSHESIVGQIDLALSGLLVADCKREIFSTNGMFECLLHRGVLLAFLFLAYFRGVSAMYAVTSVAKLWEHNFPACIVLAPVQ